ncbi:ABC transporter F family member 4-like [Arachis ipaensis]|uniref:ABC transporter F family member 4-like n=1 Tax=Arachis ipaensis TaxID=130454 RepID=UPI000A2B5769|nr:ABC transporter F family member 4-like [Arachis ipaensis]
MSRAFSIRGYAFIMRSRDVFQCWPFPTSDATAEQVRSWLPPMTVPNWTTDDYDDSELRSNRIASGEQENENPPSDAAASRESKSSEKSSSQEEEGEAEKLEIQAVDDAVSHGDNGKKESEKSEKLPEEEEVEKLENPAVVETASQADDGERESEKLDEEEEEKLEMVCPVCGDFKAATLTAVNVHMDGCLREDRRRRQMKMSKLKSKSKAPKKKRYITEIFNVEDEEEKLEQEENLMEEEEEEEMENERPEIETEMKFWPFGEDVSVTVEKFRWLSRRLEELRSKGATGGGSQSMRSEGGKTNSVSEDSLSSPEEEEEKLEMVCPVCRVFKAATVTESQA